MPLPQAFTLWGLLLGSGVATPILYPAVPVLLSIQLTGGPLLGVMSGTVFGGESEALAVAPFLRRLTPEETNALLPRLRPLARSLNTAIVLGCGLALLLTIR